MLDGNFAPIFLAPSSPSGAAQIEAGYFRALCRIAAGRSGGPLPLVHTVSSLAKVMDPQGPAAGLAGMNLKASGALEEAFRNYVEQSVPLDSPDRPLSINFRSSRALATSGGSDTVFAIADLKNAKGEPCICVEARLLRYPVDEPIAMFLSTGDDASPLFRFEVLYSRGSYEVDVGRVAGALRRELTSDDELGYLHRRIRLEVAKFINKQSEKQPIAAEEIKLLTIDSLGEPDHLGFRRLVVQTNEGRFGAYIGFLDCESGVGAFAYRF